MECQIQLGMRVNQEPRARNGDNLSRNRTEPTIDRSNGNRRQAPGQCGAVYQ
jgi:hypothetical protein